MIAAGQLHTAVLQTNGTYRAWGRNDYGQCTPPADLGLCSSIATGVRHTVALSAPPPIDTDGDGWPDSTDNCQIIANPIQADCNNDGVGDVCEIAVGAPDFNHDTIPDTCQCLADLFVDRQVNGADLGALLSQWGPANANTASDMNRDGKVDGADLGHLLASWGACAN
jgi:hypothetical protein